MFVSENLVKSIIELKKYDYNCHLILKKTLKIKSDFITRTLFLALRREKHPFKNLKGCFLN